MAKAPQAAPYVEKFDDFDHLVEDVSKAPYDPMSLHLQEFDFWHDLLQ